MASAGIALYPAPFWVPLARCLMPPEHKSTVERAQAGDQRALRQLYDSHVGSVFGYCKSFCRGDLEQAQDLTQESFTLAFASLATLRDPAAFPGFLKTTTRRCCLAWVRKKKVEAQALQSYAKEPRERPQRPDSLPESVRDGIVRSVIDACPDPKLKRVAELFYKPPPHSTAETAKLLGLSRTAVTTRLMRFRRWAKSSMVAELASALEDPE